MSVFQSEKKNISILLENSSKRFQDWSDGNIVTLLLHMDKSLRWNKLFVVKLISRVTYVLHIVWISSDVCHFELKRDFIQWRVVIVLVLFQT